MKKSINKYKQSMICPYKNPYFSNIEKSNEKEMKTKGSIITNEYKIVNNLLPNKFGSNLIE